MRGRKRPHKAVLPKSGAAAAYGAERKQSLVGRQQCVAVRHLKRVSAYVSTVEYHCKSVIPLKHGECPKPYPLPSQGAAAGKTFRGMCCLSDCWASDPNYLRQSKWAHLHMLGRQLLSTVCMLTNSTMFAQ